MADNLASDINGVDEDEALRMAIALSLGQDPNKQGDTIDLTQDEEGSEGVESSSQSQRPAAPEIEKPAHPTSSLSALGLDRKKMEGERLARLNKRKATSELEEVSQPRPFQRPKNAGPEPSPSLSSSSSLQPKPTPLPPNDKPSQPSHSSNPQPNSPINKPEPSQARPKLPFPHGVVKKTWAYGQPRCGDDIKIEEVLQKRDLQLAVLSSFQWDEEWLMRKIDLARTKVVLVAFAEGEKQVSVVSFLPTT